MLNSRTRTIGLVMVAALVGASWAAYFGGRAAGWWATGNREDASTNVFIGSRGGLRVCVASAEDATGRRDTINGILLGLSNTDATFASAYGSRTITVDAGCPGGQRAFQRDKAGGGYTGTTRVDVAAPYSLFVFVGDPIPDAHREFEYVPFELKCAGDTCEAVTWALFVPKTVADDAVALLEAVRWVFQVPGKWTNEVTVGPSSPGAAATRDVPQPPAAAPAALRPVNGGRFCVQADVGVDAAAVGRVVAAMVEALRQEGERYLGGQTPANAVQAGCPGGYREPRTGASVNGYLAMIFLPTKSSSDALGLRNLQSRGYLRAPLDATCSSDCETAPAALYLIYESFDGPEDSGDRAPVGSLREALFGYR